MGATKTKEKHPKGFYACCITFMFERLAFYGAKPLLLLFLITAVAEGGLGIERTESAITDGLGQDMPSRLVTLLWH